MSDLHLRLLTEQARRDQRRLQVDEALGDHHEPASAERRRALRGRAALTRARVAAAHARRRIAPRP